MDLRVPKILAIAPYERIRTAFETVLRAFPDIQMDLYMADLEEGAALVKRLGTDQYDAVISRGGTAELIRKVTDLPVVEIKVSVYDVLSSIKLAESYGKQFTIVAFPSITTTAHTLCDLMKYHYRIITVHDADEVSRVLSRLENEGCRMVICDAVTHTVARKTGLEAILIDSGEDSLRESIREAAQYGTVFRKNRIKNLFLQGLMQRQEAYSVVLRPDGSLYFSSPEPPSAEMLAVFREKLPEIPNRSRLHFYHSTHNALYAVNAFMMEIEGQRLNAFFYQTTQITQRVGRSGVRSFNKSECEHLFLNSFYSISGAMGGLENRLSAIAGNHQPVMIMGEPGTGKEQIARAIYLRGPSVNSPFFVMDCSTMDERNWEYVFSQNSSPLNFTGSTIYIQHLEALPLSLQPQLLSAILETGLAKREKLIFSCSCLEGTPPPEVGSTFVARLGCLTLKLPTLRSRSDEISSLANLYINSLNQELGKQISGFEPHAIEQLVYYDWPNNYTQFKQALHTLVTLNDSPYIKSSSVTELLMQERSLTRSVVPINGELKIKGRTLEDITNEVILRTLEEHDGNQSAAARQLGIGRSTLWRALGRQGVNVISGKNRPD